MSTGDSPWADPSTPTEPGVPYGGPPATGVPGPYGPSPYGAGPYGAAPYGGPPPGGARYPAWPYGWPPATGYGWSPYGYPAPWGPLPPVGPRRPGQAVAAAVLAFVQAALVLFASFYVFLLAGVANLAAEQSLRVSGEVARLASEAKVLAVVQLLSVVALVVAGLLALNRRRRSSWLVLVGALGLQVALALYWGIRLAAVLADVPGPNSTAPLVTLSLVFAASPVVGLGLVLFGPGRRWFAVQDPAPA